MKYVYRLELNIAYEKWFALFQRIKNPNLLQSWSYGEAKKQSQGWEPVRIILYRNDEPIAICQILTKKIYGFTIARINQGPLWLLDNPSAADIKNVFKTIKARWNIFKTSILVMAPNLINLPNYQKILLSLLFYRRRLVALQSGLVDLRCSVEALRSSLRGNWRYGLKAAEKKDLTFSLSQEPADFEWLMHQYQIFQKDKNFNGLPVPLLNALLQNQTDTHPFWLGVVRNGEEKVAGLIVAAYGNACTLLVNWVGDKGREVNAGNLAVWNILLHAKAHGCEWYDHGGLNGDTTVGKFKRGVPCHEYELIGEYLGII